MVSSPLGLNLRFHAPGDSGKNGGAAIRAVPITNRCNLAYDFCSRDRSAQPRWTVETAFQTLADFAQSGVLEVAAGGGEPWPSPTASTGLSERLGRARRPCTDHQRRALDARTAQHAWPPGEGAPSVYPQGSWAPEGAALLIRQRRRRFCGTFWRRRPPCPLCRRYCAAWRTWAVTTPRSCATSATTSLCTWTAQQEDASSRRSSCAARCASCLDLLWRPAARAAAALSPAPMGTAARAATFLVVTSDKRLKACSFHDATVPFTTVADAPAVYTTQSAPLGRSRRASGLCAALPRRPL